MNQKDFVRTLRSSRLLPVLRSARTEDAVELGMRLHAAGVPLLEVSWTTPDASDAVKTLVVRHPVVGAGTILDAKMAEAALAAGAAFLVAPTHSATVQTIAETAGVAYLPAGYTPQEIYNIMVAGIDTVKLFPAATGGIAHLRALRDVYPGVRFVPTGGIGLDAIPQWIGAGALAVGAGGALGRLSPDDLSAQVARLTTDLPSSKRYPS